jgi:hypothetical protein
MRREHVHNRFVILHDTLGSYLRDALQAGSVHVVTCVLSRGLRPIGAFLWAGPIFFL